VGGELKSVIAEDEALKVEIALDGLAPRNNRRNAWAGR
jgi:hypothetical protein